MRLTDWHPVLPPGVSITESGLRDHVVDQTYPLNASGHGVLRLCDGRRRLDDLVAELAREYQTPPEVISAEVRAFVTGLNAHHLLNFRGVGLHDDAHALAIRILRWVGWPAPGWVPLQRVELEPGVGRRMVQLSKAVIRALRIPLLAAAAAVPAFGLLFGVRVAGAAGLAVGAFVVAGLVHELAHVVVIERTRTPCYVVAGPGVVSVCRRPLPARHEVAIGIAGPAAALGCGLVLTTALRPLPPWAAWAVSGPFLLHAVGLLPWFNDSPFWRTAWRKLARELQSLWRRGAVGVMNIRMLARAAWGFLSGAALTYAVLFIAMTAVSLALDAGGAEPFSVGAGTWTVYEFRRPPAGGFEGHLGDGAAGIAVAAGLINALALARRVARTANRRGGERRP